MLRNKALTHMIETIQLIVSGEHSRRIDISRQDELGALASEINKLAECYQMARGTIHALNQQLRQTNFDTIMALTEALAAKDLYTRGHSERVSMYSLLLSEGLGLTGEEIDGIHLASYLHDVGKIGIPERILNKQHALTSDEYEQIKTHASISSQIISQIPSFSHIAYVVKHHHERYDGGGYPDGLNGCDIPLGARILAIADSFDAMTSARPYRRAFKPAEALSEIERCGGTQFDPELSEVFVDAYREAYGECIPNIHAS